MSVKIKDISLVTESLGSQFLPMSRLRRVIYRESELAGLSSFVLKRIEQASFLACDTLVLQLGDPMEAAATANVDIRTIVAKEENSLRLRDMIANRIQDERIHDQTEFSGIRIHLSTVQISISWSSSERSVVGAVAAKSYYEQAINIGSRLELASKDRYLVNIDGEFI